MNQPKGIRDDLDPTLPPDEADALAALGERLLAERPLPAPVFRGTVRRRFSNAGSELAWRPRRLRALVTAYAAAGALLLAVAAVGLAGIGPLAA